MATPPLGPAGAEWDTFVTQEGPPSPPCATMSSDSRRSAWNPSNIVHDSNTLGSYWCGGGVKIFPAQNLTNGLLLALHPLGDGCSSLLKPHSSTENACRGSHRVAG